MKISEFDYDLPEHLIAQKPAEKRDNSRLLVLNRETGHVEHRHFYDVLEYLREGDCLVLNDSRVIPARIFGRKIPRNSVDADPAVSPSRGSTGEKLGARVEFLLIKRAEHDDPVDEAELWEVMVRPGKRARIGDVIAFAGPGSDNDNSPIFRARVIDNGEDGTRIVAFEYEGIFMERLEELGTMPLPPYIDRPTEADDRERYQTVYSREDGSVAAPTAGLHFTEELLAKARAAGVEIAFVTLHVGIGTFRPVKCEDVEDHHMHFEEFTISREAAEIINRTKDRGGRVICVGTTSTRTIESAAFLESDYDLGETGNKNSAGWHVREGSSSTGIFIYPGYAFKMTDCLITNFHLPKSTLLMLISAMYDREKILEVYEEAIEQEYRFFSYGDAMLIL